MVHWFIEKRIGEDLLYGYTVEGALDILVEFKIIDIFLKKRIREMELKTREGYYENQSYGYNGI